MLSIGDLFGASFEAELVKRLSASASPEYPLFVDLLLDRRGLLKRVRNTDAPYPARYVLFEYDRVFLVHDEGTIETPCIACFMHHTVDQHTFPGVNALRRHYIDKGFSYLFDLSTLDILPDLLTRCTPGTAFVYLPGTVQIEPTSFLHHVRCAAPWHPASMANAKTLTLQDRRVDGSLRGPHRPDLSGITSFSGIIRRERCFINASSLITYHTIGSWSEGRHERTCGGVARTPADARMIAQCEAVERYMVSYEPPDSALYESSYADMPPEAVDPRRLLFTLLRPPTKGKTYTSDFLLSWTPAYSVTHDALRFVPAQEVWMVVRSKNKCHHFGATTNGCALGGSPEEAALHAFFELAERDSFLTSWYLQRSCVCIDPDSVSDAGFQLLFRHIQIKHPNYRFYFFDTMNDLCIPSVWLLAVRVSGTGKKTVTSAGADLTVEAAMASALREMSGHLPRENGRPDEGVAAQEPADDPTWITRVHDHATFYESDEVFHHFDFLDRAKPMVSAASVQKRAVIPLAPSYNLREVLHQIGDHLGHLGSELILKDLTLPIFRKRGLHCVRVLAPDIYPLSFGYARQRFAINDRLQDLAKQYLGAPLRGPEDLNPHIHPFA